MHTPPPAPSPLRRELEKWTGIVGTFLIVAVIVIVAYQDRFAWVLGPVSGSARPAAAPAASTPAPAAPAPASGAAAAPATTATADAGGAAAPETQLASLPGSPRDRALWALAEDTAIVLEGKAVYMAYCHSCHFGEDTVGDSPSNLFDNVWYHGGDPTDIERLVRDGFPDKNMPAWNDFLSEPDIDSVTAYLLSFQEPGKAVAPQAE